MTFTRCARAGDVECTLVCFSFDITLMKLSSLTSSLIGHCYQFALSSHLESSTVWDFCSCFSYLYSNDTFGHSNSESVSLSRYLQTGVAALLMFTSNDMVHFETTRGALVQECIDFPLQDSFFFFFCCCATTVSCCLGGIPPTFFVLSGTVLCLSSCRLFGRLCSHVVYHRRGNSCEVEALRVFFDTLFN